MLYEHYCDNLRYKELFNFHCEFSGVCISTKCHQLTMDGIAGTNVRYTIILCLMIKFLFVNAPYFCGCENGQMIIFFIFLLSQFIDLVVSFELSQCGIHLEQGPSIE